MFPTSILKILASHLGNLHSFSLILWGFLESDLFTFAVPNTIFGVLSASAASILTSNPSVSSSPSFLSYLSPVFEVPHTPALVKHLPANQILERLPAVLVFNLANLLIFDLSNQRSPESVREDSINKPWRPIPRGKITMDQTRRLLLLAIPAALVLNYVLGVWQQGVGILILTWIYNDLRGGDELFVRELLISIAYGLFNHGSLKIAMNNGRSVTGGHHIESPQALIWTVIISGVIFTTMQVQDLKDVEGDRGRKRGTIVLFLGETTSRVSIAFFILFWSWVCVQFWRLGGFEYAAYATVASVVALRVLLIRGRGSRQDARTWRLWCLWHTSLYLLPVLSVHRHGILTAMGTLHGDI